MSIFARIFKVGQASANKAIDRLEKPELMLEQAIRDKDKQIVEAKKSIQGCIATERETKRRLEKEKAEKLAWEQKAEAALKAGKEDLAVRALQRSTEHEQKMTTYQTQWQQQRAAVDELKQEILQMDNELAEFKRNKEFIIAQSKAADVKKDIYEAKARISNRRSADDLMARMKAKAERASDEADAAKELSESFSGQDSLEKEFDSIGSSGTSADVQDKLAALRAKMGSSSSPG